MPITILDQNDKQELQDQIDELKENGGGAVAVDSELSAESENPVQNKVVKAEFDKIYTSGGGITNLYNKDDPDELPNTLLLSGGSTMAMNYYNVSGYIPVGMGKTYTFPLDGSPYGWTTTGYVESYNANKARVVTLSVPIVDKIATLTISNPEVAYVRLSVCQTTAFPYRRSIYMFVEGTEYPSEYIPYGESAGGKTEFNGNIPLAQEHIDQVLEQVPTQVTSPLHGKKVVFTGDSICQAITDTATNKGWAGRIGEKHSMDWQNKGVGGGTITSKTVLTGSTFCIADTDFGENPDYIILEGGTNDADLIGSIEDARYGSYTENEYGEFNTDTFCGAVESLFKRVTTDYAGAKIGFIIAHKMGYWYGEDGNYTKCNYFTHTRRKYFDTIVKLCQKWGIPYIDLWYGCYLNPMNRTHNLGNDPFYSNGDGQHLTAKGYDYITPMIEKWMETL